MEIAIVDYGAGNAVNVKNALEKVGVGGMISASAADWGRADGIIFPGVGSFGAAVGNLGAKGEGLLNAVKGGTPFLGICLGMQLIMDGSEESPGVKGLGVVPGRALRFGEGLPVPHMGWNLVKVEGDCPLFGGIGDMYAYFVHSYYCVPEEESAVAAKTGYGVDFASALWKGNVFATQFHPEKSGEKGLGLLKNFAKEVRK